MKKLLFTILTLIMALSLLTACVRSPELEDAIQDILNPETPQNPENPENPGTGTETPENPKTEYTYKAFTPSEIEILNTYVGEAIPFIANNFYTLKGKNSDTDYQSGLCFTATGNTEAEFFAYLDSFTGYACTGTEVVNGVTVYTYEKGEIVAEISFFSSDGTTKTVVNLNSVMLQSFTADEKALFEGYFGFVIPFMSSAEYYVEDYMTEYGTVDYYFVVDSTSALDAYLDLLDGYTFTKTYDDADYGTCYIYQKSGFELDICCYFEEYFESYIIYVMVYTPEEDGGSDTPSEPDTSDGFTADEKALFIDNLGVIPPFMPGVEYYVDDYYLEEYGIIDYYFVVDGAAALQDYFALLDGYSFVESYNDADYGTGYIYKKDNIELDICCYYDSEYFNSYIVDVYVYLAEDGGSDTPSEPDTSDGFTADEKALFEGYFGFVIPFVNSTDYYVEDYMSTEDEFVVYYAWDITEADFATYRSLFSDYNYTDSYVEDGITWYLYEKNGVCVEFAYYYYDEDGVSGDLLDVYVYLVDVQGEDTPGMDVEDDEKPNSPDENGVITNEGKGLPKDDGDGVYNVDFTKGENVKDVTDQGYYLDGCPTTGSPAVLVIPVQFTDALASTKGYDISKLVSAFKGTSGSTDYFSVYEYYYISSYGQLDLEITVLDEWFTPKNNSAYYLKKTMEYYGDDVMIGDQLIMDEALAYLAGIMDLSKFDSDNNGFIDAVVLINTLDIDDKVDMQWAYRYWNIYTDKNDEYYVYDGVSANDYLWASFRFLYEDKNGTYTDENAINTYTYIHEFAHVLGADDYYDTSYEGTVMGGYDVMDGMRGDHNAFTKINLGWITTSRLVTTKDSVTLNLKAFSKTGDTIIIANNWDESLGAYQEYYIVVYYTRDGLNGDDNGYFLRDGIVVYHVNSALFVEEEGGEIYYDIYNNNTSPSDDYGTKDNLIEFVKTANDTYTYTVGDRLPAITDDFGDDLSYTFTVDSITDEGATITFKAA